MAISERFLQQALDLIHGYGHEEPLHHYLRKAFQQHRSWGARDRRYLQQLIYSWYRLGHALSDVPPLERIQLALYLNAAPGDKFADQLAGTSFYSADFMALPQESRLAALRGRYTDLGDEKLFPLLEACSPLLDRNRYIAQLLQQPPVWLRVRPGRMAFVQEELTEAQIAWQVSEEVPGALSVPPRTKLEDTSSLQKGYVEVQDVSSQRCGLFFDPKPGECWYDCCAASGGKSLLLLDKCRDVELTVSDIRSSILDNLKERFRRNGFTSYSGFVADLIQGIPGQLTKASMDGILVDAPCSGSGTWGRNPEEGYFFKAASIADFADRQRKICRTAQKILKPGGQLIYMTCSVFTAENEAIVESLCAEGLVLREQHLLQPKYDAGDTLFIAILQKQ